jgi:hypothetical protein
MVERTILIAIERMSLLAISSAIAISVDILSFRANWSKRTRTLCRQYYKLYARDKDIE